ncbi:MAG: hypothetical protein HZA02_03140 [Nitrospinae bacterium]|nr:hypothetical protein [Nitrospinota bacterium]
MPVANTVEARILVNFEDNLSGPSRKAFEEFEKSSKSMDQVGQRLRESETATRGLKTATHDLAHVVGTAFEDAVIRAQSFGDVLKGLALDLERVALRSLVTKPLERALGGFLGGLDLPIPGFAQGGSFTVGGAGGVDSQLVAFRATPGETVQVRNPGQANSPVVVNMNVSTPDANSFRASQSQIQSAMAQAIARGRRNL